MCDKKNNILHLSNEEIPEKLLVFLGNKKCAQHSVHPISGRAPEPWWWESERFQAVCVA